MDQNFGTAARQRPTVADLDGDSALELVVSDPGDLVCMRLSMGQTARRR